MPMIRCSECGYRISTTAKSCPNCGNDAEKERADKAFRNSLKWRIPLIICGLLLIVFVLYLAWQSLPPNRLPAGPSARRSSNVR